MRSKARVGTIEGNVRNLGVGNAVPGVPSGAMREHRARGWWRIAAYGGWNAEDGVPYGFYIFFIILSDSFLGKSNIRIEIFPKMGYNGNCKTQN